MTSTRTQPDQSAGPIGRRTFLRAHGLFIVSFAALVTVAAGALSFHQPSTYASVASVVVESQLLPNGGAPQPPDMATEKAVALSSTVTSAAAAALGLPADKATDGLSVSVPVDTHVLMFRFEGGNPQLVTRRAEAFSQAYVDYRTFRASSSTLIPQTAEIITPASLPTSPTGPDHVLQIGAALLLGLALGTGVAAANDRWDRHVRGPGHLVELTGSPVLAVVPRPTITGKERLVMTASPQSPAAEAYRFLQTKVLDRMGPQRVSTVLVTCSSDRDREARDVVAANLAAAAAEAGRSVVIVPNTADREALESLLHDRHPGLEISAKVLDQPPAVTGTRRPNGARGRTTSRLTTEELSGEPLALKRLRLAYDVVIVQAAPLKSSATTLMRLRMFDACLLVVDTGLSTRDEVQEAHREATLGSFEPVMTVLTDPCSPGRSGIATIAERLSHQPDRERRLPSLDDAAPEETLA